MKNQFKTVTFVFLTSLVGYTGCNSSNSSSEATGTKPGQESMTEQATSIVPASALSYKLDPVCEMNLEEFPIADTLTYNGKLLGFCNVACKKEFLESPDKFTAKIK